MSDYVTLAAIKGALPDEITAQLLDDDGTGVPNATVWSAVVASVTREINGKIGQRYPLPLTEPFPELVTNAAFVLAAELCYQRRNFHGDANPWSARADGIRGTMGQKGGQPGLLDKIADGSLPLTPEIVRKKPSASVITERAKTSSCRGAMSI